MRSKSSVIATRPDGWITFVHLSIAVITTVCGSNAWAAGPSLEALTPALGTRGTSFTVTAMGSSLQKVQQVVFYRPGLRCVSVEGISDDQIRLHLEATVDSSLGPHPFRLLSEDGFSELRTVTIGPYPTVAESVSEEPQWIDANVTILGTLEGDDVDRYIVRARSGERLSAECVGVRLGSILLDTILTLRDPQGKVIMRVDDTPMLNQDPAFSLLAPTDGDYMIEIAAAGANADADSHYALHIGHFLRPSSVFPLGGKSGSDVEFTFYSADSPDSNAIRKKMKVMEKADGTDFIELEDEGLACPTDIPIRINRFEQLFAGEDAIGSSREINATTDSETSAPASEAAFAPVAVHGRITRAAEVDRFSFQVKQATDLKVEVFASRLGSLLDSVVDVRDENNVVVSNGDDFDSHDTCLVFRAKPEMSYTVSIRDKRQKFGVAYAYCVEVTPMAASIATFLPRREKLSQLGQTITVPSGNRSLGIIGIRRNRISGPVQLQLSSLPLGVVSYHGAISDSEFAVPMVFSADSTTRQTSTDAQLGALVSLDATILDEGRIVRGGFEQIVDLVNGPADALYHPAVVDKLAVAVARPVPFSIELLQPSVPLSIDGTLDIEVQVQRDAGFDAPIDVVIPLLPPWVDGAAKTRIAGDQDSGVIQLRADVRGSEGEWSLVAEGSVGLADKPIESDIGALSGVTRRTSSSVAMHSVCSSLHRITLERSPVRGSIEDISAEQESTVEFDCEVLISGTVPESMIATIEGLPNRIHIEPVRVARGDRCIRFKMVLEVDAPANEFRQLFCRLSGSIDGQNVSYCIARGTKLMVAEPGKAQTDDSGRPLSPLEALRLRNVKRGP